MFQESIFHGFSMEAGGRQKIWGGVGGREPPPRRSEYLKNKVVRYRGINKKGVLDRPWTIWKVLRAISSTLKCQFTGNHENKKTRLFGEAEHRRPGSTKLRNVIPLISVLPKLPQLPYGVKKFSFPCPPSFLQVH